MEDVEDVEDMIIEDVEDDEYYENKNDVDEDYENKNDVYKDVEDMDKYELYHLNISHLNSNNDFVENNYYMNTEQELELEPELEPEQKNNFVSYLKKYI